MLDIDVEVVKRSDTLPRFMPARKRWIVEQVYGTLMLHCQLVREYETRPESSVSRNPVGVDGRHRAPVDRHQHPNLATEVSRR